MTTNTHDEMIAAFQEYFKWQDRFEYRKSDEAGAKARLCLARIRNLANSRRDEIQAIRKERKAARNGKNGRPLKIIT